MKFFLVYGVTISTWIILSIIGALGPPVNVIEEFGLKKCLVGRMMDHISDQSLPMVDLQYCEKSGKLLSVLDHQLSQSYKSHDVIFFVSLPVKQFERKMSRLYHYLLADIDIALKSDYVHKLKKHSHDLFEYHVSIGYRNNEDKDWTRLDSGNASRVLDCHQSDWGTHVCRHFPLFELWSCHYEHYLINLRIPLLPLTDTHIQEFKGISAVRDMSIVEIHQHPLFTIMWFIAKAAFFLLSLIIWIIYRNVLIHQKYTLYLLYCVIFLNVPVELLSLYYNIPWIVVLNDFRSGLMIGSLCLYWTIFISQMSSVEKDGDRSQLRQNWCSVVLILTSCTMFFVYEFCERGIQVIKPFYSIWGTYTGKYVSYIIVTMATVSALAFLALFLVQAVKIMYKIRSDVAQAKEKAKERLRELLGFVLLTSSACLFSILGYILPVEIYLLHWMHDNRHLSLYGALLMSNYGLWNVYVFGVIILYSKIRSNVKLMNLSSQ